jgi:hypothetical protein
LPNDANATAEGDFARSPKTRPTTSGLARQKAAAAAKPADEPPASGHTTQGPQASHSAERLLADYIRDLVEHAPPLSDEQRTRLSWILSPQPKRSTRRGDA